MSTSGDIRWLHKYRVLVCRSRYCSPWDWWVGLFPQTYSAARGEMVASSTTCPSWRPLWKFEEAVESQTWECKSNIKSCNGHKQQCFSWNGSSWVIFGSSSKGMKPQAFCFSAHSQNYELSSHKDEIWCLNFFFFSFCSFAEWESLSGGHYLSVYYIRSILLRVPAWLPWPVLWACCFRDCKPRWSFNICMAS